MASDTGINWAEWVGAIGQWAGAIGAIAAVWVATGQTKEQKKQYRYQMMMQRNQFERTMEFNQTQFERQLELQREALGVTQKQTEPILRLSLERDLHLYSLNFCLQNHGQTPVQIEDYKIHRLGEEEPYLLPYVSGGIVQKTYSKEEKEPTFLFTYPIHYLFMESLKSRFGTYEFTVTLIDTEKRTYEFRGAFDYVGHFSIFLDGHNYFFDIDKKQINNWTKRYGTSTRADAPPSNRISKPDLRKDDQA